MAIKEDQIHIKINAEEKKALVEAAEKADIPVSQFVREATREKIATIRRELAEKETAATV